MKNIKRIFIVVMLLSSMLLTSCSFVFDYVLNNNDNQEDTIKTFEFVNDDKMVYIDNESLQYHRLELYAGEEYQIKTTIDDKLGDTYYFKYKVDDEINDKFSISETGYIKVNSKIEESETFMIDVELYKKGNTKRIVREYFALSLNVGEYANIVLTNENIEYDQENSLYYLTVDSGSAFYISYSISYNTQYIIDFSLTDSSYSSFMNVLEGGKVTTVKTSDDKTGIVSIKVYGTSGLLNEVFLKVNIKKSEDIVDRIIITNLGNATSVNDGDILDIYVDEVLSFDIKYNDILITDVITVGNINVLDVNNNTIKGIKAGISIVTFKYESQEINITINVVEDEIIELFSENEDSDFLIINSEMHYLNNMYLKYESGKIESILDESLITFVVTNVDDKYKTVTFKYQQVTVSYDVKYYVVEEYEGQNTAYDNNDYFNNSYYGKASVLPNEGTIKMLVIPVWFNDSNVFFSDSQKNQIIEDINYTLTVYRPNTEFYSVKQYYEIQSFNSIEMDFTISDFYYSNTSYKDYTDNSQNDKKNNDNILASDAISWYFENNLNEKFEDYDLNSDGFLDGLVLLYGANYYGVASDKNSSIAFESTNYGNEEYLYNSYIFCPIGGLYGLGKKEPSAQLISSDLSETFSSEFRSSARIIIHEVGHMFGNEDLYELTDNIDKYYPAGGFVMQDNNYGSHDPYHLNRIGWTKPQIYASSDYELGDKITIHLADFQTSGQNIILTNTWNSSNSLYDEYLIIELFVPTGLNEFDSKVQYLNMANSGIRLWHVNSLLFDYMSGEYTSKITNNSLYELSSSNTNVESKYDLLHLIRNNPNEEYNTVNRLPAKNVLFNEGDSFDMETFKSQFINNDKFDNGDKLGWKFIVEEIYKNEDGTYGAIITLERIDNVKTEFSKTITLNRSDLITPDGEEDYSKEIFGENGDLTFIYKYVTPPSIFVQNYPISTNGMCLFASADGLGGYIDLSIKQIDGKNVSINSISITYSKLTNATITGIVDNNVIEGVMFKPENTDLYGIIFDVNSTSIRIQNQYNGNIDHWSVLALFEITINYTIS